MSKKLILLAVGALTALAFTALPSIASASEFKATCSTGNGTVCKGTVSGGHAVLETDAGGATGTVTCTSVTGNASFTGGSSTGTAKLTFHTCSSSGFTCGNVATGTIETNEMVAHLVTLEHGATLPVGVLMTGVNVTFSCAGGFVKKTVTGNVMGEISNPNCNTAQASHALVFAASATVTGSQKYTQITTTGTVFDLTSGAHASDTTTSSQAGTGTVSYTEGKKVTLDC